MAQINLDNGLPSPASSARSPGSTLGLGSSNLPTPRSHPLKPGSSKEDALINYVDDKILRITRRYAKKFSNTSTDGDKVPGYTNFDQVLVDLEPIFDVVWISRTPSVQIPYLLSLAGIFGSYMRSFPLTEKMFHLARKFDLAFSSLLNSSDSTSTSARAISITEKVRIKSLIEDTRVNAVRVATESGINAIVDDSSVADSSSEDDTESVTLASGNEVGKDKVARRVARIYELTLSNLGDTLGSLSIPAMSDDTATIEAFEREQEDEVIDL